ncbi:hypothetical protein D3C85_1191490 [compost metagenome]
MSQRPVLSSGPSTTAVTVCSSFHVVVSALPFKVTYPSGGRLLPVTVNVMLLRPEISCESASTLSNVIGPKPSIYLGSMIGVV